MLLQGCQTAPKVNVHWYAGDSANAGISRAQDHVTIKATSPQIDQMACLSYEDLKALYKTYIFGCSYWGNVPMLSKDEFDTLLRFVK